MAQARSEGGANQRYYLKLAKLNNRFDVMQIFFSIFWTFIYASACINKNFMYNSIIIRKKNRQCQ
ncbi:MAG: hypothetical protein WCI51_07935, partial [Lentisphaerota bacterium]